MKPILAAAALLLAGTSAYAQQPACFPLQELFKQLEERFHGTPAWMGTLPESQGVAILFQGQNGTWTLVQSAGETGCVVGMGIDGKFAKRGQPV